MRFFYIEKKMFSLKAYKWKNLVSLLNSVSCVLKTCSGTKVPCVLTCSGANVSCVLTCSRATCLECLHAYVPTCLPCLHAHASTSRVLTCSRVNVPCLLTCSRDNVPYVFTCSRACVPKFWQVLRKSVFLNSKCATSFTYLRTTIKNIKLKNTHSFTY